MLLKNGYETKVEYSKFCISEHTHKLERENSSLSIFTINYYHFYQHSTINNQEEKIVPQSLNPLLSLHWLPLKTLFVF